VVRPDRQDTDDNMLRMRFACYMTKATDIHPELKKAIPLQAWTSPEGSRRLRLPDFKTIGK